MNTEEPSALNEVAQLIRLQENVRESTHAANARMQVDSHAEIFFADDQFLESSESPGPDLIISVSAASDCIRDANTSWSRF
jgi:hypothetical protein